MAGSPGRDGPRAPTKAPKVCHQRPGLVGLRLGPAKARLRGIHAAQPEPGLLIQQPEAGCEVALGRCLVGTDL